jgi:hypothetical protein
MECPAEGSVILSVGLSLTGRGVRAKRLLAFIDGDYGIERSFDASGQTAYQQSAFRSTKLLQVDGDHYFDA